MIMITVTLIIKVMIIKINTWIPKVIKLQTCVVIRTTIIEIIKILVTTIMIIILLIIIVIYKILWTLRKVGNGEMQYGINK